MNNKMQVVNLLPAELRQQRDAFDVTHLGRYLVLMLLLLLLLYLAQYWQIEKRQRVVAAQAAGQVSLQQQLQELKRSIPADEKQRLQNEVQRYQRAIAERRDIRRAYA
ncbi:MAG: hypothetical protein OIF38_04660, partial [Cellvibrionaceae bacterium]|nr:hypothetical protein [Cellvibrionaceae bacterium]